jgi:hypothetical protein
MFCFWDSAWPRSSILGPGGIPPDNQSGFPPPNPEANHAQNQHLDHELIGSDFIVRAHGQEKGEAFITKTAGIGHDQIGSAAAHLPRNAAIFHDHRTAISVNRREKGHEASRQTQQRKQVVDSTVIKMERAERHHASHPGLQVALADEMGGCETSGRGF